MRREQLAPMRDVIVRYSAAEMPVGTIERLQCENCEAFANEEIDASSAFRICNLLLNLALLKLDEATS